MPPTTRKKQAVTRRKRRRRKARKGHVEMASASTNSVVAKPTRKSRGKSGNCPICHKPVKGALGLSIHNAKKSVQAEHQRILGERETNGSHQRASRTTPHVRVSRLREKWMYRANEASPEVREAILDCIIDLSTEFR